MSEFEYKAGSLVTLRNRPWIVLPSEDRDLLLLKPLGGTDLEITGIYKPLANAADKPQRFDFVKPSANDLGDFASAKLLYNAARLSFRNAAGPFRCLGKLSFRPRSYQMVPLIMALKQDITRLLIADDVGVGKTIEGLLIAKELYERKEIKRFAVVCLPHLCDQWQDELKNKFGIEAVVIRSGTATALERQIRAHENIFRAFPFQVISIDYIKSGSKRQVFIDHCPEMILVDEAHSCAKPAGANTSQQLRHKLLNDISKKENQHLILLTATPHSGKQQEFQSLLGLLKPEFENNEVITATETERKALAKHFIQRRRGDVVMWLDEETKFPERKSEEMPYEIGPEYAKVFDEILTYARDSVSQHSGDGRKQRYSYWDALALLRGVMSSPAAGISMLQKKAQKKRLIDEDDMIDDENESASVLDLDNSQDDNLPLSVLGKAGDVSATESTRLLQYAKRMQELYGIDKDRKAKELVIQLKTLLERGFNPIVFCRYIQTANYLGEIIKPYFSGKNYKNLHVEVVTSELNDELRREKIEQMNQSDRRLLIATDCLSEGINLQEGFNALLHYDLPWNPNRLEQREGRIDRFGQEAPVVEVGMLYGSNNPIDGVVLDVLLRKAREIRRTIGISVPFPENSASVMEAVTNAVLLKPSVKIIQDGQLSLFDAEEIDTVKTKVVSTYDEAANREKVSRSVFAQHAIKAHEIENDLRDVDEAIGNVQAVEDFVVETLRFMGVQTEKKRDGYKVFTTNLPQRLRELLGTKPDMLISFKSPTPGGYKYIGRNHPFTEHLSQFVINNALQGADQHAARAAVMRTDDVTEKTVLFQLRVRNVIAEQPMNKEIVAEEMWLWGYTGEVGMKQYIDKEKALALLMTATPTGNMEEGEKAYWLGEEMNWVADENQFRAITDEVALERANHLVESHTKFKKLVSGSVYKVVEPVLPMDVLGIYIFLPKI
jgi:superfamily II DNA or RNA helicase